MAALRAYRRSGADGGKDGAARRMARHLVQSVAQDLPPELLLQLTRDSDFDLSHDLVESLLKFLAAIPPASGEGVILVVEDDRLTARVHADALERIGLPVVIASDADEAEVLLREHRVSIFVLDLVLPRGDGRDLLMRLRAGGGTRSIPIIVVTGRMDAATQAETYAFGADAVLTKPVDPDVLAAVVAAHLDHAAERRRAGRVDTLTGLANRAALSDAIQHLAPLSRRTRNPLCIAMIDLDHFKGINDSYGHEMGDVVLQRSASTIVNALRVSDIAARWGGEEFCILLPDTSRAGAVRALSKALQAVRDLVFHAKGEVFSVSFSAGVALVEGGDAERAIGEADRLLYLAKKSGRNRVFSADDESDPPRPRVLLVEDDESVGRVISTILQREGFAVVHHTDGESALKAAAAELFVLAVVDVNLPKLNGLDLVTHMRRLPATAKMPVVLLTGSHDEDDIVRGFEVGASDYVTKPFLPRELAARINRLVPRR